MLIEVYGKQHCQLCDKAKFKVNLHLKKWDIAGQVPVKFLDLDTVDGAAEGAFHDVRKVPTTLLKDGEEVIARWDGGHPDSRKMFDILKPLMPGRRVCASSLRNKAQDPSRTVSS